MTVDDDILNDGQMVDGISSQWMVKSMVVVSSSRIGVLVDEAYEEVNEGRQQVLWLFSGGSLVVSMGFLSNIVFVNG